MARKMGLLAGRLRRNDNAGCLDERVVWTFFASKLAPTEERRAKQIEHTTAFNHSTSRAVARLPLLILI
ncbi:hypothetical protein EJA72_29620, partial [Pseudomonas sp. PB120]|nr:hypothetical protein [Pseudomonas sp. PB120]